MKQGWKTYLLYSSVIFFAGGFLYILVETINRKNTGFETKTLWDWMELLIIPAVLAGGAILLNRSERDSERERAEERAKLEREIATDRQQEVALQTYFDRMSELLLKEKLRTSKKTEVRDIARTRTLSIMQVLNTKRNNLIIQFLREAKLITDKNSILSNANMNDMDLRDLDWSEVFLEGASFFTSDLQGAIFAGTNLKDAKLYGADLRGAYFYDVSNLQGANFSNANLQGAFLARMNFQGVGFIDANMQGADLSEANLRRANLRHANLRGADLEGADLSGADLRGANLQGVDLSEAKNLTDKQLASVKSLKGATMPDGTKYE